MTSRHPATVHWSEIARVLTPGGTYFAQHVGGGANVEVSEYFQGPLDPGDARHHEVEADQARASGLEVVQCRNERLLLEFFDVGAMVFFLRKVVWTVPEFTVDRYRARLLDLHEQIEPTESSVRRRPARSSKQGNRQPRRGRACPRSPAGCHRPRRGRLGFGDGQVQDGGDVLAGSAVVVAFDQVDDLRQRRADLGPGLVRRGPHVVAKDGEERVGIRRRVEVESTVTLWSSPIALKMR